MKKHILFVIPSLRPGGAERQLVELAKGLDKDRYTVSVVVTKYEDVGYQPILENMGIAIYCFKRQYKYDISPLLKTINLIRKLNIDVVHTFLTLGSLIGVLAAKFTNRPVVCSALRTAKDESWKDTACNQLFVMFSDYFVSNSKAAFENRFRDMKANFRVVYNGIDFDRFVPYQEKLELAATALRPGPWRWKVAMVASLSDKKDHRTFLQAAKIILANFPDVLFVMVGESIGGRREQLEHFGCELGIQNNLQFMGFRSDVDQLMHLFDVLVLLTEKHIGEGSPNAVLEGVLAGKPVVASRGGGTNEVVTDLVNGLLVDPGNAEQTAAAILRLLKDEPFANKLAVNGKKFVEAMCSLQNHVAQYETMYQDVLAK
jgi:glycosyltransferase involved in cell wall biosynthesis